MLGLVDDLKQLIRTRHPIVTIRTVEEQFAARQVGEAAGEMGRTAMEWSIADGLRRTVPTAGETISGTGPLAGALRYVRDNSEPNVYVLKDALRHVADATVERLLRDAASEAAPDTRTIFLIDPGGDLPLSLQPLAVPYDLELPDAAEIRHLIKETALQLTRYGRLVVDLTRKQLDQFVANLRGLTRVEIAQVVADSILDDDKIDAADLPRAVEAKRSRLGRGGVLEFIPPPETPPDVGGMDNLRKWLAVRADAWGEAARQYGLEAPRGILMLGVQGCGKSLMARHVAAQWQMPLLRMDVGALYDKFVGETERHLRAAFQTASAIAPCVLWIDEIEKAFASASAGPDAARSDGGLSQRMFGMLLTWMQERKEPVFLVATANDIAALPPELLRKGRFDEVFFVDLPSAAGRKSIFGIHLRKRNRDARNFDLPALAAASEGFSGAEIEQALVAAMYAAFAQKREVTTDDLLAELKATRPLSVVMAEKVASLRAWAEGRCVRAD